MGNQKLFGSLLTALFMSIISTVSATSLEGIWRNERQNLSLQISEEDNGIRAKRSDQSTWYRYTRQRQDLYTDINGNAFRVLNDDAIEWREANSTSRIVFYREGSGRNNEETARDESPRNVPWINRDRKSPSDNDRTEDNRSDDDRWEDRNGRWTKSDATVGHVAGRWYNKASKQRLEIEQTNNGYRVRTQHGQWEKYTADRNGTRLRSNSGDIIRVLDRNTIQWRSDRGGAEKIFVRQGNGKQGQSKGIGQSKGVGHAKGKGHDKHPHKEKHAHKSGKKCCG